MLAPLLQCTAKLPGHTGESISEITYWLPTLSLVAAKTRTGQLTYWKGRRGGRRRVGRSAVHQGLESVCSRLHTFHRNHLYYGPCSSGRGNIALMPPFVHLDILIEQKTVRETYYANASDVFAIVGMAFAVTR